MKAVVLETRGRRAAVLAKDGSVRVVHGSYSVGEIIEYGEAARPSARQWIAAGVAMVMLLGASAGLWVDRNFTAYAEVSLDINPSMVFTVNKRDRVLGVRAANADAEDIVEQLRQEDIRFSTVSDAMEKALTLLDDEGYLDESAEDYVLINVSADDDARQERLSEAVETAMERTQARDNTLEYRIDRSDRDTARAAKRSGMSAGRYAAWQQDGGDEGEDAPALEEYAQKPVRELLGHGDADRDAHDASPDRNDGDAPSGTKGEIRTDEAPRGSRPDAASDEKTLPEAGSPKADKGDDSAPRPDGTASHEAKEKPSDNEDSAPDAATESDVKPSQDMPAADEASAPQDMPALDETSVPQDVSAMDKASATQDRPSVDKASASQEKPSADEASEHRDKPTVDEAVQDKRSVNEAPVSQENVKPSADAQSSPDRPSSKSTDKTENSTRKASEKPSGNDSKSRSDSKQDKAPSGGKSDPSPSGGKPGGGDKPGPH